MVQDYHYAVDVYTISEDTPSRGCQRTLHPLSGPLHWKASTDQDIWTVRVEISAEGSREADVTQTSELIALRKVKDAAVASFTLLLEQSHGRHGRFFHNPSRVQKRHTPTVLCMLYTCRLSCREHAGTIKLRPRSPSFYSRQPTSLCVAPFSTSVTASDFCS